MGYQDRPYYRDQPGAGNPLLRFLSGSVPLFTAFGIRVRAHMSMVILIAFTLITAGSEHGMGIKNAMTFSVILFGIILLHEFGHCFAARWVGGDAKDILLWPLGGLAFADAPRRPGAQFITAAGGPAVNVVICILCGVGLAFANWGDHSVPWLPLSSKFFIPYDSVVAYYLWWIFIISWGNLLFNLVPVYPLDGGRLFQSLLWFKLGYYRSMMISTVVGMVGSVLMAMYGLAHFGTWYGGALIFIGVPCFATCFQMRAQLKAAGPWGVEEDDSGTFAAAMWSDSKIRKHTRKDSRRAVKRAAKLAERDRTEQAMVDAILAKVSAHGMQSLGWRERRTLRKATEHQREHDAELARNRG